MKIACIILNYNTSSDCRKCASFLTRQEDVEVELIFVDNNSSPNDRKGLKEFCQEKGHALLENQENKGYNAGNNVGLRYAAEKGYEYALIANPDMEFPHKDYLSRMVNIMEKDTNIAVCGSDIVTPEGIHQSPMKRDGNWKNSFGWIKSYFRKSPPDTYSFIDNYKQSHYCHKVSGCCLMVRMTFIQEIGYFDEYPFLYCEEAILSRQVELSNKWKMYYLYEAQAIHRHIKSEKGDPIARFKQWRRSRIYFNNKYNENHFWGKVISNISIMLQTSLLILVQKLKH